MLGRGRLLGSVAVAALLAARPAVAQIDLSGEWSARFHEDEPHRGGVEIGDYTGMPINPAARMKAESWDEGILATHERQCIPHVAAYALRGPANIEIHRTADPDSGQLVAWHIAGSYGRPRTIWMDGRPHPSEYAPHTWAGFSTGWWDGNALIVTTTHIKMGWIPRNGVPTSDRATMEEHFIRHGDHLMVVTVVNDPVYLEEPFIRTSDFVLTLNGQPNAWGPCAPHQIADESARPEGNVPHHLPGANSMLGEFPEKHGVPPAAALGGARGAPPPRVGSLKAVTTNLRAGYLRRNGVPYSTNVTVTEYFDRLTSYDVEWLTVLTQVDDPKYLTQPFITSTHFKHEPDGSGWMPTACEPTARTR